MDFNGLFEQLNINWTAVVINIVGFLLLLWVANRMVFKPIGGVIDERERDISSTYDQIDADRRQMETLRADYEQRLASIEAEAREKIQSAIKDAQAARDQIVSEANTRAREMTTRAEEEIDREREQAMISMRQQIVDLALSATRKTIGDSLDENRQRRLIDDFIENSVSGNGSGNGASAGTTATAPPPPSPPAAEA